MSNSRTGITPETAESMRQFEVVAKVAIQSGVCHYGASRHRVSVLNIGMNQFGLSRNQSSICLGRAQVMLSDVSDSVSSETLLIAERRRQLRVLKRAA